MIFSDLLKVPKDIEIPLPDSITINADGKSNHSLIGDVSHARHMRPEVGAHVDSADSSKLHIIHHPESPRKEATVIQVVAFRDNNACHLDRLFLTSSDPV